MLRFIPVFLLALSLASPVRAESAPLRYHTLTRHWAAFEELAPEARDRVRLTVRVDAPHASGPVAMWMEVSGRRYDLAVDGYGLVQVPRTPDIIAADPVVESNQPRGSLDTELALLLLPLSPALASDNPLIEASLPLSDIEPSND